MLKEERYAKILGAVNELNYVSLHDLMKITESSESTIRADLVALANEGKIIRLRGGAQAINDGSISYELTIEAKMGIEVDAKKRIAEKAATLIKDNSIIYIDAGTSTYYLADAIVAKGIKIVTNSISIAKKLIQKGYQVFVIGGEFKSITDAFIGSLTREFLLQFNFDLGFFGCNGIDISAGITTPDLEEALVKKTAVQQCKKHYFLADHTKFGVKTAIKFDEFDGKNIITDKITNKDYINKGIMEVKEA